jgi:hypothetical protein
MSEFEVGPTAFGGIFMTALFVTAVIMSGLAFTNSVKTQTEDLDSLTERSTLHLVEHCLKNGKEYLDGEFLDKNFVGFDLCLGCGICSMGDISARVEAADGWYWESYGYSPPLTEEQAHEIFVNIERGKDVLTGKLILRVNG